MLKEVLYEPTLKKSSGKGQLAERLILVVDRSHDLTDFVNDQTL